ncbi:hypothetical protein F2P81_010028 [Scophthalmus maximus]|uniref:Uncharacterized protein n=1 Tax=Scophthalmus maximus TaxID=52904 RepID=A0A6A4T1K9_SCOMX|nr:hypothetical protein F2P81_010028 [Scophthalmus maximus]
MLSTNKIHVVIQKASYRSVQMYEHDKRKRLKSYMEGTATTIGRETTDYRCVHTPAAAAAAASNLRQTITTDNVLFNFFQMDTTLLCRFGVTDVWNCSIHDCIFVCIRVHLSVR